MLIIDKKRLKLKESGLPQIVIDQTPWYMRRTKIPVVKAKIGPKIQTLISETTIFDSIPVKKEIKAVVSGIYITEIKSVRGGRVEAPQQKKSLRVRLSEKLLRKSKELNASAAEDSKGIDNPADHLIAYRNFHNGAGSLYDIALFDIRCITEQYGTYVILLQVEHHAPHTMRKLQKLTLHRLLKAVDTCDTICNLNNRAHFCNGHMGRISFDLFFYH